MQAAYKNEYTEFKTGNLGVDALLVDKQAKAKENNTQIRFSGRVPSKYVSSLDLCLIIGNALDNAIEACAELSDEKSTFVESDMANGFFSMRVSNSVKEIVPIYDGTIASTKTDKENHGIGLVSIGNCVKKYDGSIKLLCDEKMFVMEIECDLNPLL